MQEEYYKDYVNSYLKINEVILKDDKRYVVIEEEEYYKFMSSITPNVINKIEKNKEKTEHLNTTLLKEKEQLELDDIKDKQFLEKEKAKKERSERLEQLRINETKRQQEANKQAKEEAIEKYTAQAKKDKIQLNIYDNVNLCYKCKFYKCNPYDYTEKDTKKCLIKKQENCKEVLVRICDDCVAIEEERLENLMYNCEIGRAHV